MRLKVFLPILLRLQHCDLLFFGDLRHLLLQLCTELFHIGVIPAPFELFATGEGSSFATCRKLHGHILFPLIANDTKLNVAALVTERATPVTSIVDALISNSDDDIAGFEATRLCSAALLDRADEEAGTIFHSEKVAQLRRQILDQCADTANVRINADIWNVRR